MSPAPLDVDRVIEDRYVLEARIGRGGMGEVWRARHLALKSQVAIKFLQSATGPSERARRRFLTEAQVTAQIKTRHAVQVFDFGVTSDGLPYIVMELLVGESLDRRIARRGRLGVGDTARILQKAARALERAHALGIVHRDFKPENIMLVPDDEEGELVKVVDFGIAKLVGDLDHTLKSALGAIAQAMLPRAAPRTRRGMQPIQHEPDTLTSGGVGTPHYMAPEQVQDSAQVGPAADVWAFGVVAYECLTGRRPFEDESVGKLLLRVLAAEPPVPASSCAPVPEAFDMWFRTACARSPIERFPDIQSAAAALATALGAPEDERRNSPPAPAPTSSPPTLASLPSPLATTLAPAAEASGPKPASGPRTEIAAPEADLDLRRVHLARRVLAGALVLAALALMMAVRDGKRAARPIVLTSGTVTAPYEPPPPPPDVPAIAEPPSPPPEPATPSPASPTHPRRSATRPGGSAYHLPPLGL